jgi:septal ring factor EnvC (AmiA/AmiB activator)
MTEKNYCPSHEYHAHSIQRQEEILEQFRKENAAHKERISRILAEICAHVSTIKEVKTTQVDNMQRREDFAKGCEDKRAEMWTEIQQIKSRQDKKDGTLVIVAGVCTSVGAAVTWLLTWLQKHV